MTAPLRTVRDAAHRLGVSVSNIYRLVAAKQLAYVDITAGHRHTLRFTDEDLEAFIARRRVAVADARTPQMVAARAATATLPLPSVRRFA